MQSQKIYGNPQKCFFWNYLNDNITRKIVLINTACKMLFKFPANSQIA